MTSNTFDSIKRRGFLGISGGVVAARSFGIVGTASAADAMSGPVVETTNGKVRGAMIGKVNAFKGIPYGASTAGARRFLPAIKPAGWTGTRDALDYGLRVPQPQSELVPEFAVMDRREPMGEDCLCLNVWTTGLNDGGKRPVMLWLHGGGFMVGSAAFDCYDGTNLAAKHDVVVVGVNHRLNIFGYLYLADLGVEKYAQTSNLGMTDIIASLQWVKDNIEKFGGDPSRVTVFGQSGGGSKVSTLLGMPAAKGLFHRAIVQSGSQVTSVKREDATAGVRALLTRLEIKPDQLDKLQEIPTRRMMELAFAPTPSGQPPLRLSPVVDGKTLPANNFDPVATAVSADVPMMIGSTETEVTWTTQTFYDPLNDAELKERVKQVVRGSDDAKADKIIATYKKNRPKASNLDLALIIATDNSNFRIGTDTQALRKAELGKGAVYKYYFQWYSPVREGKLRAMHCMDIPFAYDNVEVARAVLGQGPAPQALADRMSAAWTAFAKTGNPNHAGIPQWKPYTPSERATMVWNNECSVVNNPFGEEKASLV